MCLGRDPTGVGLGAPGSPSLCWSHLYGWSKGEAKRVQGLEEGQMHVPCQSCPSWGASSEV